MSKQNQLAINETNITNFLAEEQVRLSKFAARNYKEQEFFRSALLCISESDKLIKCLDSTEGKMSLYNSLKKAATTGLSLNPLDGKAALTPYEKKGKITVGYQIMKNGMIELAQDDGGIKALAADTVREHDVWDLTKSMGQDKYTHKPARKERGPIDGFYASVELSRGETHVSYMTVEEVEQHRDRYGQGLDKERSAWNTSFEGMAIKTVIKKLLRNLHISPILTAAVSMDDSEESKIIDMTPRPDPAGPSGSGKGHTAADVESEFSGPGPHNGESPPPPDKEPEPKENQDKRLF